MSYICVEGNIGAGKTKFAQRYAELTGRTLILEQFTENPFLTSFYENPIKHAFPLEMSFLAERFQQLSSVLSKPELFSNGFVADYTFEKTRLFARINLTESEFRVFDVFFQTMERQLPKPDVVVYLKTDLAYVQRNIQARSRAMEMSIPAQYLSAVHAAYQEFQVKSRHFFEVPYSTDSWQKLDSLILDIEYRCR